MLSDDLREQSVKSNVLLFLSSGSKDQSQTNENGDSLKIDHIQQNYAYNEGFIYKTFKKIFRLMLSS